ncbi:MAG TPA: hypothetical protein VI408_12620 [Gaiellaceae bacterium]
MTATDLIAELVAPDAVRTAGLAGLLDAIDTRPGERPEETLLDLGLVDDRRLALSLAWRSGRPYQGLRGLVPDPRLFLYLPLSIANRERCVPLALRHESLRVASAFLDPDLGYLDGRFPNLRVELVVSPRREILAALQEVAL